MRRSVYALVSLACFGTGAYLWKLKNGAFTVATPAATAATGGITAAPPETGAVVRTSPLPVVEVGKQRITQDDIDWEYDLVTSGVFDKDSLTPIPDLGSRYRQAMQPLRRQLVETVVERKLLYEFIQQDRDFGYDRPSRYTSCLAEWQQNVKDDTQPVKLKGGKERLKARLCERSLLDQYMHERLFAAIKVAEPEIVEYYKNHEVEFHEPEKVEIRQILLADEDDAKRWRAQVNPRNFAALARAHSIAPEAAQGGRLGPFARGTMPPVFDVAFQMKKGEISAIQKSSYGYHIILLVEHFPKTELGFDAARPRILARLRKRKEDEEYSKWVERALAAINVSAPKATW